MTRLEQIHALLRRMEQAYREALSDPSSGYSEPEISAQLHETRELFAEELARIITSIKGELSSPVDVLSNPRELRSALSRALPSMDPDVPELMSDSLSSAARSLLS